MSVFVFTCGDINGIGPEVVIKTLQHIQNTKESSFIIISPASIFEDTYTSLNSTFKYTIVKKITDQSNHSITVLDIGKTKQEPGKPTRNSGQVSFRSIMKSYDLVNQKKADAIITAPISKYAFTMAGIEYPGHTELFAELAGVNNYMMMFVSRKLKCGLVTIHEPLKKVSSLLKQKRLEDTLDVTIRSLGEDFNIKNPSIAVLGFNPHAGENGKIGSEEEQVIKPVILSSKFSRYITGPYVSDAFFGQHLYKKFDIVIGMYHDQVLIPFKMLDFSKGVNYTAGLPFVRTSPDHGTAFNIAGQYIADASSMIEAFKLASKIVQNRKRHIKDYQEN